MEEKPAKVRRVPVASKKSAALVALATAFGVNVALCAVLVAITCPQVFDGFLPGEVTVYFVPQPEATENDEPEQEPEVKVKARKMPTAYEPPITTNADPLAMQVPEPDIELADLPDEEIELMPEELEEVRLTINEQTPKPKRERKKEAPTTASAPVAKDENVAPDKKVRYKHVPSLPESVNSSKVGRVKALVKVAISVSAEGAPTTVSIVQSSGNAELDRLFMRWVKENWSFYPAEKDGKPIAGKVVVPVRLNID